MALAFATLGLSLVWLAMPRLLANNSRYHQIQGNTEAALGRAEQARRWGLDETLSQTLRFEALFLGRRYEECLKAAEILGEKRWGEPQDWLRAALAALELGQDSRAHPWLRRYAEAANANPASRRFAMGALALAKMDPDAAAAFLSGVECPTDEEGFFAALYLERALRETGRPAEAFEPLIKAKSLRPDSLAVHEGLARCYRELGDGESFRWLLDEIRRLGGNAEPVLREDIGALSWLDSAMSGSPGGSPPRDTPLVLEEMNGPAQAELGRLIQALQSASAVESLIALGRRLEIEGRLDDAAAAYAAGANCAPNSLEARFHRVRSEKKLGANLYSAAQNGGLLLADMARQSEAIVQWRAAGDLIYTADNRPFDGVLVRNGSVSGALDAGPGALRCVAALSATTVDGVGAWALLRCQDKIRRFYVDSPVPRLVSFEVFVPAGQGSTQVRISFVNDLEKKEGDRTIEDRNLGVLGLGLAREPGGGS